MGRRSTWGDPSLLDDLDVAIADRPEPDPQILRVTEMLFGPEPGWSPDRERKPAPGRDCPVCGSEKGPIQPGSTLACAACLRTGSDQRIARALAVMPSPKPDRKRHWKQRKGKITVPERYADRIKGQGPT